MSAVPPAARRFLFGEDFRAPAPPPPAPEPAGPSAAEVMAAVAAAERVAYDRGREDGRREAEEAGDRRLADAAERLGGELALALSRMDAALDGVERDAVGFFGELAARLAGALAEREPLAAVAEAGREAFRHLRGIPHLAARVDPGLVEPVETLLRRLARENGFEGRIIVLADDEVMPGDIRLDWADGGVVRERHRTEAAILAVLARLGAT